MDHHGLVTVARDADHAIQNAVFFELACEIILRSGNKAVPLPDKDVQALLKARQSAGAGV
jgi:ribulose-5-phosphate 4-epimerase/fuculose-1-phosphate aldolase